MANTLLTSNIILRKALQIAHQKANFIGTINRQYDSSYGQEGAKNGATIRLRLPNQYTVTTGANLAGNTDTTETSVSLTVATQKHVDTKFSSQDLTLSIDDFAERILEPAMAVLVANVEADALSMAKSVYYQAGTPGTNPSAFLTYMQAKAFLDKGLAPSSKRSFNMTPDQQAVIVDSLKGLFQDSTNIASQYKDGMMGRAAGGDWYMNTLLNNIVNGSKIATTVSGAAQTGAALTIVSVAADTWKAGSTFTLANVFRVHPETKQVLSELQQFVVTADITSAGATTVLAIAPAIVVTGPYQNVSASPASGAAVTFTGTALQSYSAGLHYFKDAFTFATADLVMPKGVDMSARDNYDGLSLRFVRQYDINTDNLASRIDILYGYLAMRPEWASRIAGA